MVTGERAGRWSLPTPFIDSEQTPTIVSLDACAYIYICVCICLHPSLSYVPIYMRSIQLREVNRPSPRMTLRQQPVGLSDFDPRVHLERPLHKDALWEPDPSPRTENPIFSCDPVTLNPWDSPPLGQHKTASIQAHKHIPPRL